MSRRKLAKAVKYIVISIMAAVTLLPILYMLLSGFKTTYEINQVLSMPRSLYLENFKIVLLDKTAMFSFVNSFLVTAGTVIICVLFCSIASYPLARRKDKLFVLIYIFFLSAMMIPAASNLATLYSLINNLNLKNTRIALILIYTALQTPMGILLYTGFIKGIPRALDEAAVIDGCGYIRRFFMIIFPLLKPVTLSYVIISTIYVWNEFMMALLLISDKMKKPVTLAVYSFVNEHQTNFGAIYAMLIIAAIPPVVLFLVNQKHFYSDITVGSVK